MAATRVLAFVGVLVVAGCGETSGGGAPTGPSTGAGTPTSLSMTPQTDLIRLRGTETFTLTAALSNGSSQTVQGNWGSDQMLVATAVGGRVTAIGSGQATIFADYQGLRATRLLRVVPSYDGRWTGDFQVTGCSEEGDWRLIEACRDFLSGERYFISLVLTQERAAVTGTLDLGDWPGPVEGSIAISGHLQLAGTLILAEDDFILEGRLFNWDTVSADNEGMSGRFTLIMQVTGIDGWMRLECDLRFVKTSATAATVSAAARGQGVRDVLRRHARALPR
jgi:hypothetical protein